MDTFITPNNMNMNNMGASGMYTPGSNMNMVRTPGHFTPNENLINQKMDNLRLSQTISQAQ